MVCKLWLSPINIQKYHHKSWEGQHTNQVSGRAQTCSSLNINTCTFCGWQHGEGVQTYCKIHDDPPQDRITAFSINAWKGSKSFFNKTKGRSKWFIYYMSYKDVKVCWRSMLNLRTVDFCRLSIQWLEKKSKWTRLGWSSKQEFWGSASTTPRWPPHCQPQAYSNRQALQSWVTSRLGFSLRVPKLMAKISVCFPRQARVFQWGWAHRHKLRRRHFSLYLAANIAQKNTTGWTP